MKSLSLLAGRTVVATTTKQTLLGAYNDNNGIIAHARLGMH